jgi:hypothetical protein
MPMYTIVSGKSSEVKVLPPLGFVLDSASTYSPRMPKLIGTSNSRDGLGRSDHLRQVPKDNDGISIDAICRMQQFMSALELELRWKACDGLALVFEVDLKYCGVEGGFAHTLLPVR